MPNDVTAPLGQVRLLIVDTTDDPVFSDPEVATFLVLEGNDVKCAAALAFETIAADEALTSKVIRSQDLQTDGAAVAAQLLARAASLRQESRGASGALAPRGSFPPPPRWPC